MDEFDPYETHDPDNEEPVELDDEDYNSDDDYAHLDEGVDRDVKENDIEEDGYESLINDIGNENDGEGFLDTYRNVKRVKKSNIIKISKYEYSRLYGNLAQYLMESRFEVPPDLERENPEIINSCDCFIISRFWIENRHKYPLPMALSRNLYLKTDEIVDVGKLKTEDELSFKDEEDDTYRFHYNFRDKPYETCW